MAGFFGACLSLAQANALVEKMVAGRGFIEIACGIRPLETGRRYCSRILLCIAEA